MTIKGPSFEGDYLLLGCIVAVIALVVLLSVFG